MGEALGIDLRGAACAAARWRAGTVEGCSLGDGGPTATAADLGATGTPGQAVDAVTATVALLRAVADRAGGRTPGDAVAVAYAFTPDDGPRALADRAVAVAFGEASGVTSGESPGQAFVVARPVAVAARVAAGGPDARDGVVAVLDMTGGAVDVALVRVDRHGFDLAGPARTLGAPDDDADMAAHLDGAVDVLDEAIAGAGLGRADIRAVRAVGDPAWLAQLAVQVRVATGLDVAVDPEPEVAAAMGAAILAAGPDRPGRRLAGGVAVVGSAAAPLVAPTPVAGPEVGATAGRAISPGGGPADALGDALGAGLRDGLRDGFGHPSGDGPGAAPGEAVGDGLADGTGARFGRLADRTGAPDGTVGGAAGEAVGESSGGPPGAATGAAVGDAGGRGAGRRFGSLSGAAARRGLGRRGRLLVGAGAAAVALVTLVGAIQVGGRDGDGTAVETSGGRDGDRSGSTADRDGGPRPPASGSGSTTAPSVTTPPGPTSTTVGEDGSGGAGAAGTPSGSGTPAIPASEPLAPAPGGSSPGGPSPSDPPPTTATTARDATGPSITGLNVSPGIIDEDGFEFCERPKTAQVSATVSDPSGVTGVIVSWSGNGMSGSTEMAAMGSTWQGTLGPVPDSQLTLGDGPVPITWSVTAVDGAGNSATKGGQSLSMYGC